METDEKVILAFIVIFVIVAIVVKINGWFGADPL
jgi:hypothetical protein